MTLARKHKVIVEVTFNKPLTDHDAVKGVNRMLERIDLDQKPVWDNALNIYVDKWQSRSFGNILPGGRVKEIPCRRTNHQLQPPLRRRLMWIGVHCGIRFWNR